MGEDHSGLRESGVLLKTLSVLSASPTAVTASVLVLSAAAC